MSREIDLRKKLSARDRQYLLERGRNMAVWDNDAEFGDGSPDPERDPFGIPMSTQPTGDMGFGDEMSGHTPTVIDLTVRPEVANPEVELGEDGEIPPYDEWTVKALKTEAKARGLTASGDKEELVQRLQDFDAAEEN